MEELLKYSLSLVQEKNNGKRRFTMLMRSFVLKDIKKDDIQQKWHFRW